MDGPRNKGSLMEPALTLVERRVRLEHHMLEMLELERGHLVKKERLLEKSTAHVRLFFLLVYAPFSAQSSRCWRNVVCRLAASLSVASETPERRA